MRYKNKMDMWLKILLHFSVLVFAPIIFTVPADERYIMIIITVVMAIIIYPLFWGYCEIRDD